MEADRDESAIPIGVPPMTGHRSAADLVRQCKRSAATAWPDSAIAATALLVAFGRIDGVQPDSRTPDLQRVSIHHRGNTDDTRRCRKTP